MMSHKQIINKLLSLDLSTYPCDEIRELIQQFGKFGGIGMTINPGKVIIRARVNEPGQKFTLRKELSYRPAEFNTNYQRASIPGMTMFYGGTIPEDLKDQEVNNARIIAFLEAIDFSGVNSSYEEQTITFSKWIVTKPINLFAICYHEDFVNNSSHTKEMHDEFHKQIKLLPIDLKEKSKEISSFLANQFAKSKIKEDFDYMISAIFSKIILEKGVGGVYYPSVRVNGKGYNVAIAPEFVDSSLNLVVAGECKIYIRDNQIIVDNESVSIIKDDTIPFIMQPVNPKDHIGKVGCLNKLNNGFN